MSEDAQLRRLAFAAAYRMLGSVAEAEDVAQDAMLRAHGADGVRNAEAFVTTAATRLAIDVLRSARVAREAYVGSWLPEPIVDPRPDAQTRLEDDETISIAFLALLERLGPVERAVLVLREAFDFPYDQIAEVVGRSEENTRQVLSRARRRIADERPRFDADPGRRRALADGFLRAARDGDVDALIGLLAEDAVLTGDGGGKARAIPTPLVGADRVGRAIATFARLGLRTGVALEPVLVNGQPGLASRDRDGAIASVLGLDVEDGRIVRLYSMLNPDKLRHLGPVSEVALRPGAAGG